MANEFKNFTVSGAGTTPSTLLTVPVGSTVVVIGLNLANVEIEQINVDVEVAGVYLVKGVPIPSGSSLSVLDGKIILMEGDSVSITSSLDASCDAILSVLEQTTDEVLP